MLTKPKFFLFLPILLVNSQLNPPPPADYAQCQTLADREKLDCFPEARAGQGACEARGCCWIAYNGPPSGGSIDVPYCFFPPNYNSYSVYNVTETDTGYLAYLGRSFSTGYYPDEIQVITINATYETNTRLRVKISDPLYNRFETPYPKIPEIHTTSGVDFRYRFSVNVNDTGFQVLRTSDETVLFDTVGLNNFIFADQFLQLSAKLSSYSWIYGLGEHRNNFLLTTNWERVTMFNHDVPPGINRNLYGAHPFYLYIEESGNSHGVFLKNSNPMDVILQPGPIVSFRPIGGVLDFYFFLGPTPAEVVGQYLDLIGRPYLPPYWGLGFHLCRYGYPSLDVTKATMQRNIDAGIPLDTQWNDLDYMDNNNDFTYNKNTFAGLPEFVQDLHERGMHYIPLIDPGVSGSEPRGSYPPFDVGVDMDVFVKEDSGEIFYGKVWNAETTVWPDFTHPNATLYWTQMLQYFHDQVEFDGAWIDMNEPSNFLSGSTNGCPDSILEHPPYVPAVEGGVLNYNTMCMTAKQYAGVHYDVHNLFGISEAEATYSAMVQVRNKRPVVISRSSFAGHGNYSGHWSGDIGSGWEEMKYTISELLSFSLFGVPLMGADICGFNGDTTESLCNRWMQLGAFYPFSRNHNTVDAREQDPAILGDLVIASSKKALQIRYSLLPYLYSLFWRAHIDGSTVARPLFFEFPYDQNTYNIDYAFLWGSALLIIPVLEDGATDVFAYIPDDVWYDFYSLARLPTVGREITLDAPLDTIPLLIRGGYILPQQQPEQTTTRTRLNKFEALVALNDEGYATGSLYWDDGESLDSVEGGLYSLIWFTAEDGSFYNSVFLRGFDDTPHLGKLTVLGVSAVADVTVNGDSQHFNYDVGSQVLVVEGLDLDLMDEFKIVWS